MERDSPLPNLKEKDDLEKIMLTMHERTGWGQISEMVCKAERAETTRNYLVTAT